jgi:hypothetical protein
VDGLSHVKDRRYLADQDLLLVIHQVRGQSVRTPMSVKVWCAENHFPKELLLVFWQLIDEGMPNELLVRDHA